uniref:Uncharacterized protein n=1 Tax=Zea mays TaxID=4577 RepID=B7ZWS6_MAIZE|nr:unknown [Zea mays]|eukprot:XP_020402898.1 uncharacterized protein LOC100857008 [Zea mays]
MALKSSCRWEHERALAFCRTKINRWMSLLIQVLGTSFASKGIALPGRLGETGCPLCRSFIKAQTIDDDDSGQCQRYQSKRYLELELTEACKCKQFRVHPLHGRRRQRWHCVPMFLSSAVWLASVLRSRSW